MVHLEFSLILRRITKYDQIPQVFINFDSVLSHYTKFYRVFFTHLRLEPFTSLDSVLPGTSSSSTGSNSILSHLYLVLLGFSPNATVSESSRRRMSQRWVKKRGGGEGGPRFYVVLGIMITHTHTLVHTRIDSGHHRKGWTGDW